MNSPTPQRSAAPNRRRGTLIPPPGGAVVRMYRIGHGDCFLLGFDGEVDTVFVLIDCGYKPGSQAKIGTDPDEVVADFKRATGGRIDVMVITHEHQDHVNAITTTRFADIAIDHTWLAWTESADDEVAQRLRARHRDTLKALVEAHHRLGSAPAGKSMAELLALEIGGEEPVADALAAFGAAGRWTNKDSIKLVRDRATHGTRFLYPHEDILALPGAKGVRVFPLGPPRDEKALRSLDPVGEEGFGDGPGHRFGAASFFAAALADHSAVTSRPFARDFTITHDQLAKAPALASWYTAHYGPLPDMPEPQAKPNAKPAARARGTQSLQTMADNAAERRIESDWLLSAEAMALKMGNDTNNGSLVLAFELGKGGKVLLFAGDAQRGNWMGWAQRPFAEGESSVEVRELLGRTVLYKVGHHGSHNATLKGDAADDYPNLGWFGRGRHAREFTAMVPAVREWALALDPPWDHPLPEIREALLEKCGGRVLQTDTPPDLAKAPEGVDAEAWKAFAERVSVERLYFDYAITPG